MKALASALALLACLAGCSPQLGDSCQTSADCSVSGERICDTAQPGGYCTVRGCDPGTCPGSSVCVEWRYDPPRTAETWCMAKCKTNGGCRQGAGYRCVRQGDDVLVGPDGSPLAQVLEEDGEGRGFCAAVAVEP